MLQQEQAVLAMYDRMLGSQSARDEYREGLCLGVNRAYRSETNMYEALATSAFRLMRECLGDIEGVDDNLAINISVNASKGLKAHAAGLSTVGRLYIENAGSNPQPEAVVMDSVDAVSKHIFAIAFSGSVRAGSRNLRSLMEGQPPAFVAGYAADVLPAARAAKLGKDYGFSPDSFIVKIDNAGHISVKPRYSILREGARQSKTADNTSRCDGTKARVEIDGSIRSALATQLDIAGDVAVKEIYPIFFTVVSDQA